MKRKKISMMKKRYLYVGYCSLTAPLLNIKQEPWAEQRAEEQRGRRDGKAAG